MTPTTSAERVTCSSCRSELVDGACRTHGPRKADGTSPHPTTVLRGKGDQRRTVAVDAEAIARIDLWLDRRKALGISAHCPVFCSLKGRPLPTSYLRELLPRLAAKAEIDKRVHPHGLRHSLAHELVMNGIPLTIIQQQLGHHDAHTTSIYLQHIAPRDVVAALRALPPWDEVEE